MDRRDRYSITINQYDLPINPNYIQQVTATGVKLLNRSKWLNSISIQTDDSLALVAIRELPFVKSTDQVALRKAPPGAVETNKFEDPADVRTADFDSKDYNTAYHQLDMLHGTSLHKNGFRGEGITIAVFDGGWYNTLLLDVFDSLYNDSRVLGTWDFVRGNDSVYDFSTHGTQVLSAMAANKPGFQIGTAPDARFYLFVTEDVYSEYPIEEHNWAAAAEVADSLGVDLISSSLGYSEFTDPSFNHSYNDMNGRTTMSSIAANMAARKGMIVCSSAGNEGTSPWYYITSPADADSILTVGATDSTISITAFSSHGPTVDGRIKPEVTAQGIGAWVIDPAPENNSTYPGNGTSFSNPILAGVTACLWQAHQDKSNIEVMNAIKQSASLYYNPNDSFGYGIPNFELADLILSGLAPDDLNINAPVAFPNPFNDQFGILYYMSEKKEIDVVVNDMAGKKVAQFHSSFQAGYNYLPISLLKDVANGSYIVSIQFDDHRDVLRLVKVQK